MHDSEIRSPTTPKTMPIIQATLLPLPPTVPQHLYSIPACGSVTLKSYVIRQDFSAIPFSFLLKMVGKHGCKNGSYKPSKTFSHSDTSLSSHHMFQGQQLKVHGVPFCTAAKRTTLHDPGVALLPLSCTSHVA